VILIVTDHSQNPLDSNRTPCYSLTASDQIPVAQNADHHCLLLKRNRIAVRFHGANSMLNIFHCVHKTQNSPVAFDFVFCDCEIIKALRGHRIEAHSCSNSQCLKGV
jgi:hypothetical protein